MLKATLLVLKATLLVLKATLLVLLAMVAVSCSSEVISADSADTGGPAVAVDEVRKPTATPVPWDPAPAAAVLGVERTLAVPEAREFPPPPGPFPDGPLTAETEAALDRIFGGGTFDDLELIGASGDIRLAWLMTDLMRFARSAEAVRFFLDEFIALTGVRLSEWGAWTESTNLLMAWDVPAPPDYREWKSRIFLLHEPRWEPFFADEDADIDWRVVSWGGVPIDDRPISETVRPCPFGCIPALNDPAVTDAAGGDWYPDDGIVFGIEINGEARAYPKNIMEVHEMVNDTLGGRRIGVPYCTLCGSAQGWFTDDVSAADAAGVTIPNGEYELRTSGLLTRSNKVMFELHTMSVFDTFTGLALSGPLQDAGVQLEPVTVVTTTWADWRATHPDTTIAPGQRPWGGDYPENPLGGRDDNGPIFPIGMVDDRLVDQESVLGVINGDGRAVAFPAAAARSLLLEGEPVIAAGVRVRLDGAGLRAEALDGTEIASHQAFWFAWSQFHPETALWLP